MGKKVTQRVGKWEGGGWSSSQAGWRSDICMNMGPRPVSGGCGSGPPISSQAKVASHSKAEYKGPCESTYPKRGRMAVTCTVVLWNRESGSRRRGMGRCGEGFTGDEGPLNTDGLPLDERRAPASTKERNNRIDIMSGNSSNLVPSHTLENV